MQVIDDDAANDNVSDEVMQALIMKPIMITMTMKIMPIREFMKKMIMVKII